MFARGFAQPSKVHPSCPLGPFVLEQRECSGAANDAEPGNLVERRGSPGEEPSDPHEWVADIMGSAAEFNERDVPP